MFNFHNKDTNKINDDINNLNEKEEISYYDAFNYILKHRKDLKIAIDFNNDGGERYYLFGNNYFFTTDNLLDLLLKGNIDFFNFYNEEAYLSINSDAYKFDYDAIKINEELSSSTKLSDDSKIIFNKIKAIIDLISNIRNKIGSSNFVSYYYFYCNDKDEAIKNITSVVKIFDKLRKLTIELNDNCKKDIFKRNGLSHEQLDKCLSEIISDNK